MKLPLSLAFAAFAAAVAATPALAQDVDSIDPEEATGDRITVGLGGGFTPAYEGSDQYLFVPVPLAQGRISGIDFQLRGPRLYLDVLPAPIGPGWDVILGPAVGANFNRTRKEYDDPRVTALGKLDMAIEVGARAGVSKTGVITSDYDSLSLSVAYLHDVTDTHGSYVVVPEIAYGTPLSTKAYVGISGSAEYVGDGYARTYFGITPAQSAASGFTPYTIDGGWKSWTVALLGDVALTGDLTGGLSLVAAASYRRMLGDFAGSPLVAQAGSRDQWFGALGLAYTF